MLDRLARAAELHNPDGRSEEVAQEAEGGDTNRHTNRESITTSSSSRAVSSLTTAHADPAPGELDDHESAVERRRRALRDRLAAKANLRYPSESIATANGHHGGSTSRGPSSGVAAQGGAGAWEPDAHPPQGAARPGKARSDPHVAPAQLSRKPVDAHSDDPRAAAAPTTGPLPMAAFEPVDRVTSANAANFFLWAAS